MIRLKILVFFGLFSLLQHFAGNSYGANKTIEFEIQRNFDDNTQSQTNNNSSDSLFPHIDLLFENRVFQTGINAGSDVINRSIESLMESIFYSLLDRSYYQRINNTVLFRQDINRNVFSTSVGSQIIADTISYGPEYKNVIGHFKGQPIYLGANGKTSITNIRVRSDASRLYEKNELPLWRKITNNWFGLLPILTQILPPSFNGNELYDPIKLLEVPFVFPLDRKSFDAMPIGSIRSYAISGGVNLPLDIGHLVSKKHSGIINDLESIYTLPYTVFIQGEHRINVLKKNSTTAWVGLSNSKELGHAVTGLVGNTFYLLKNSIKKVPWTGIESSLFPVDINLTSKIINGYNVLYEFNLSNKYGAAAYKKAVAGDFGMAKKYAKSKASISYHFTKERRTVNTSNQVNNNLFVWQQSNSHERNKSEIKVSDELGEYFILEGNQANIHHTWNILSGPKNIDLVKNLEIRVNKDSTKHGSKQYRFRGKKPYQLIISLQIKDHQANSTSYRDYISLLTKTSSFNLSKKAPKVPIYDSEKRKRMLKASLVKDPSKEATNLHLTPTIVGKFIANLNILFSWDVIQQIISTKRSQMWKVFYEVYRVEKQNRQRLDNMGIASTIYLNTQRLLLYPLRLFNIKFKKVDALHSISKSISDLKAIRKAKSPTAVQNRFYNLFNNDYPILTLRAMIKLAKTTLPQQLIFFIKPSETLDPSLAVKLTSLNTKSFKKGELTKQSSRYLKTKSKQAAFFPKNKRNDTKLFQLKKAALNLVKAQSLNPLVQFSMIAASNNGQRKRTFYFKIETTGKIQLGKRVLGEQIVSLESKPAKLVSFQNDTSADREFKLYLNGPKTPLDEIDFDLDQGSSYILKVSSSLDGQSWSNEHAFKFRYNNQSLESMQTD